MKDEIVVKRYADAFMGFAKETVGLERALRDLKNLKHIINNNPEFLEFLKSASVAYSQRFGFIDKILEEDFSEELRHFLKLLLEKGRIGMFLDISEYIRINYTHIGKTEVVLKTSFPLDLELIQAIEEKLEDKFKKKFKFYLDLDGRLLGGVQIKIGNTLLDGSLRRRLEDLKDKLMAARI
jgi:F-type H+-transporting ATPase subunit delta